MTYTQHKDMYLQTPVEGKRIPNASVYKVSMKKKKRRKSRLVILTLRRSGHSAMSSVYSKLNLSFTSLEAISSMRYWIISRHALADRLLQLVE